jgi:hypothetical protein
MGLIKTLRGAAFGWRAIIRGDAAWRGHFDISRRGLLVAILFNLVLVLIGLAITTAVLGIPSFGQFVLAFLLGAVPLLGLALATIWTYWLLRAKTPLLDFLIPEIYAFSVVLLIGTVGSLAGSEIKLLMLGALAYIVVRAAQVIGGFRLPVSIAFAVLTIVVLVALPRSLYMLAYATGLL